MFGHLMLVSPNCTTGAVEEPDIHPGAAECDGQIASAWCAVGWTSIPGGAGVIGASGLARK